MKKSDILLINADLEALWKSETDKATTPYLRSGVWEKAVVKEEACHILDALIKPCKHGMITKTIDMAYGCKVTVVYNRLVDCPECMKELNAILNPLAIKEKTLEV